MKLLIIIFLVAGCSARTAEPVRISQAGDADLTCEQIRNEILANRNHAMALAGKDQNVENDNTAAGTVGALVFWPAMFAFDLSQKEQIEMRAYQDRNRHLNYLLNSNKCL